MKTYLTKYIIVAVGVVVYQWPMTVLKSNDKYINVLMINCFVNSQRICGSGIYCDCYKYLLYCVLYNIIYWTVNQRTKTKLLNIKSFNLK